MKILQLNSAFYLVFAYGRTVNVGHLLHMGRSIREATKTTVRLQHERT